MIGIIIQARLGSSRLPNKMVLPFYNNKGVFEIIVRKLKKEFNEIPIIVSTTTNSIDSKLVELCKDIGVGFYRGSENDVLQRFIDTSKEYGISKIIRICADNPFIDINYLSEVIDNFKNEDLDYCSFKTSKGVPTILTHYGFWGEAVSLSALIKVKELTKDEFYYEHVTNFIYSNPNLFRIKLIFMPTKVEDFKNIRMTIDTKADFLLLQEIYSESKKIKVVK